MDRLDRDTLGIRRENAVLVQQLNEAQSALTIQRLWVANLREQHKEDNDRLRAEVSAEVSSLRNCVMVLLSAARV